MPDRRPRPRASTSARRRCRPRRRRTTSSPTTRTASPTPTSRWAASSTCRPSASGASSRPPTRSSRRSTGSSTPNGVLDGRLHAHRRLRRVERAAGLSSPSKLAWRTSPIRRPRRRLDERAIWTRTVPGVTTDGDAVPEATAEPAGRLDQHARRRDADAARASPEPRTGVHRRGRPVHRRRAHATRPQLDGSLIFMIGCHAGDNLPTAYYGDVADWADVFSAAGGFVGNTGYGLANNVTTALGERLLGLYADWIGVQDRRRAGLGGRCPHLREAVLPRRSRPLLRATTRRCSWRRSTTACRCTRSAGELRDAPLPKIPDLDPGSTRRTTEPDRREPDPEARRSRRRQ